MRTFNWKRLVPAVCATVHWVQPRCCSAICLSIGVGGIIAPFFGIKLIDVLLTYLRVV
jgi:high-affinity K+ transport system ATPase subunit B